MNTPMARVSRSRCSSEVRLSAGGAGGGCGTLAPAGIGGCALGGVGADLDGAGGLTGTAALPGLVAAAAMGPEAGTGGTVAAVVVGGAGGFIGGVGATGGAGAAGAAAGCAGAVAAGAAAGATGGKLLHAASTTGSSRRAAILAFTVARDIFAGTSIARLTSAWVHCIRGRC